ncbi:hypothetical protein RHGRI_008917 [Rhododendron griersonianum]|uniref:Uncharacterized protein n=1 Tax=Rhododendron griersonianum TaxID=479676 RepID=A0AAV6L382_9ERIC|nr:hypothetical protein RHGRI_008917 [Rhododendron griersonianum]
MRSTLFKLCLAASVYYLWKERNGRIFQQLGHDHSAVEKLILEEVKSCTSSWKHEIKSPDNFRVCCDWRIIDSVFLLFSFSSLVRLVRFCLILDGLVVFFLKVFP